MTADPDTPADRLRAFCDVWFSEYTGGSALLMRGVTLEPDDIRAVLDRLARAEEALRKPPEDGWESVMKSAIGRFRVAATVGGEATWNSTGALAMAELLTELSRYVDRARAALRGKDAP